MLSSGSRPSYPLTIAPRISSLSGLVEKPLIGLTGLNYSLLHIDINNDGLEDIVEGGIYSSSVWINDGSREFHHVELGS